MASGSVNISDVMTLTNNQVVRSGKIFSSFFGFDPFDYSVSLSSESIDSSDKSFLNIIPESVITLTSTPSISSGFDGKLLILRGTSDTNTLTLQDKTSLSGSGINLGGVNRVLGDGDYLILIYSEKSEEWEEIVYKDN